MLSLSVASAILASLFVSPQQAQELIGDGATVLDARAKGFFWAHLPGARPIDWLDYRDGWGRTGRLTADVTELARRLAKLGVTQTRPVLVYGDAERGFGEEGRIAWMLAYLGHPRVLVLDGGIAAWRQQGRRLTRGWADGTEHPGSFHAQLHPELRADKAAVQEALGRPNSVVLDVRTAAEWGGATPYLEARGGHIPGAQHLDWRALLSAQGQLRPASELRALMQPLGIHLPGDSAAPPSEIIVYCTGGVRSAYVWAGLRSLGLANVRNYDGSFWEWAADRSLPVQSAAGPAGSDAADRSRAPGKRTQP
jgi:thiosulfate/3-mercaptopyruvate sulfurtransferase